MIRYDVFQYAKKLAEFSTTEAPKKAMRHLPQPFVLRRQDVGTVIQFIARVMTECHLTLRDGDREQFVSHPRYQHADVAATEKGLAVLLKSQKSPETINSDDIKTAVRFCVALNRLATLYLDKAIACNISIPTYQAKRDKIWQDFENACQTADYNRLAELYPFSDGILEIEVDHFPKSQQRMVRAQALREIFEDAESLDKSEVRQLLRDPEIGFNPEMIRGNERQREIFMEIWGALQTINNQLQSCLPIVFRNHNPVDDIMVWVKKIKLRDIAP